MKAKHTDTEENDRTLKLIVNSARYPQAPSITVHITMSKRVTEVNRHTQQSTYLKCPAQNQKH